MSNTVIQILVLVGVIILLNVLYRIAYRHGYEDAKKSEKLLRSISKYLDNLDDTSYLSQPNRTKSNDDKKKKIEGKALYDFGDVYTINEFLELAYNSVVSDYDGSGNFVHDDLQFERINFDAIYSLIDTIMEENEIEELPDDFWKTSKHISIETESGRHTHIVWYNR